MTTGSGRVCSRLGVITLRADNVERVEERDTIEKEGLELISEEEVVEEETEARDVRGLEAPHGGITILGVIIGSDDRNAECDGNTTMDSEKNPGTEVHPPVRR